MPIVLKLGSLTILGSVGPAQACKGIALPLQTIEGSFLSEVLTRQAVESRLITAELWLLSKIQMKLVSFVGPLYFLVSWLMASVRRDFFLYYRPSHH